MHAEIRRYKGDGANALFELLEQRKSEIQSVMQTIPGFVSYSLMRTNEGGASFTVCGQKSDIEQSARIAHDWIVNNAANLSATVPEIVEGSVIVHMA